jgi:uncharacterized membrane protein YbjE (DUF340 family)
MKSSLIIFLIFSLGLLTGYINFLPEKIIPVDAPIYILYLLMFLVGISLGTDIHIWEQIKKANLKILLIPLTTVIGTMLGIFIYSLIFNYPKGADLYAIGAGFGYYSFSGIFISNISGETMGIIALMANIIREILALILTPILVKYFGKIAPIAAGGATTSDTTLPVIMKFSGKEYVLSSVINGVILTLAVPFFISFIYSL